MTYKFPVKPSLLAFILVPFVNALIYALNTQINTFAQPHPPWMQGEPFFAWSLLGFAVLISLPAYLAFLVLGVPALYCLYRFRSGSFWSFALVGLIIASITWLALGLGPLAYSPHQYWNNKISELCFAGPVGALCGVLTRLIILGTGHAWKA